MQDKNSHIIYAHYGKHNRYVVGAVKGQEFRKNVNGSTHFLRKPRAICFGLETIDDARMCGATYVHVHDNETGKDYYANISTIFQHGFFVNRGYGKQIALTFKYWESERPVPQLSFIEKGEN